MDFDVTDECFICMFASRGIFKSKALIQVGIDMKMSFS